MPINSTISLKNVRLSFPALFKPKAMQEGDKPKYSCAILLDKKADAAQIDALSAIVTELIKEKWPKGKPAALKVCVRDGSEKSDMVGYGPDVYFLSASNEHRPAVVGTSREPLDEESGRPYAGCYCNIVVRLWAQDNNFGKRINAQLKGIQFAKDGEAFGEAPFDPEKEFEVLDDAPGASAETEAPSMAGRPF